MTDEWSPATTPNFTPAEMACQCGKCGGEAKMSQAFMERLQRLRERHGPLIVTSAYRCPLHELTIRRPSSYHAKGRAVDLAVVGGPRKRLLLAAAEEGFNGWGVADTFTHLDDRDTDATWTY
jgi:hypothetical protein